MEERKTVERRKFAKESRTKATKVKIGAKEYCQGHGVVLIDLNDGRSITFTLIGSAEQHDYEDKIVIEEEEKSS